MAALPLRAQPKNSDSPPSARVLVWAFAAVACGLMLYAGLRPAASAQWWPASWQIAAAVAHPASAAEFASLPAAALSSLMWISGWLPALLHSFAFSLLSALVLPRQRAAVLSACLAWALINTLAEASQHPAISAMAVPQLLQAAQQGVPFTEALARYAQMGWFDWADIAAAWAGSGLAAALLWHPFFKQARPTQPPLHPQAAAPVAGDLT